mmetsp:Transcript_43019/g.133728  ORF Transcript_43019/g.133728 Transcript_43019/m.133728 type:complete len:221 (+) Transcript_43019:188-850(+)
MARGCESGTRWSASLASTKTGHVTCLRLSGPSALESSYDHWLSQERKVVNRASPTGEWFSFANSRRLVGLRPFGSRAVSTRRRSACVHCTTKPRSRCPCRHDPALEPSRSSRTLSCSLAQAVIRRFRATCASRKRLAYSGVKGGLFGFAGSQRSSSGSLAPVASSTTAGSSHSVKIFARETCAAMIRSPSAGASLAPGRSTRSPAGVCVSALGPSSACAW